MSQPQFLERSRYYLAYEYPTKIRLALGAVDEQVIWKRANAESNSIANLMLHLAGNIREWIVCGIGGEKCDRDRASEFSAAGGYTKRELSALLDSTVRDADRILATLSESDLSRELVIQDRQTTVLAAIYHVVEHFSMHTGQIILLAKTHTPGAVRFYENAGGVAVPLWGGKEGISRVG